MLLTFEIALLLATFLCSLVAGFLFAFAAVVMPGLRRLDDREFLRAFQAIDRIIQNGQPLFLMMWVGSALALIAAAILGMTQLSGADRVLLAGTAVFYIFGVQAPTIAINIPMNNTLQRLDPASMGSAEHRQARVNFEARWNRWNVLRTVCACVASGVLILIVERL